MTEQVIDIRDRIEKMRNQMTVPGAKTASTEKKHVNEGPKTLDKKNVVTEKKQTQQISKSDKKENFNSPNVDSNPIEKKKIVKNEEYFTKTNVVEKPGISEENKNYQFNSDFKTYSDYQNDRVTNEKKQSVNLDDKQPFPQFSLNVSNPISWKLMLLIMLMQLLTNMMLVVVLYLK